MNKQPKDRVAGVRPVVAEEFRDDRPSVKVLVDMPMSETVNTVLEKLGSLGWDSPSVSTRVFQRGGNLVHITSDCATSMLSLSGASMRIRTLPKSLLRERITQAVALIRPASSEDGEPRPIVPPAWLVDAIYDRGEYPRAIRPLAGIVECPTLRTDGTVIQRIGYDAMTGLCYWPAIEFPEVSEIPTREDAAKAASALLDVVGDFPFSNDDHRSAWLAMVLTLVARPAIAGPCPLFSFDANCRGAGKSKLVDVASIIATGHDMPRRAWVRDDGELRKVITSVALEAVPSVLFDNLTGPIGGPSLDMALQGTSWTDRILGKSETTGALPLRTVWMATGNNIEYGGDTARRALPCRLESPHESPEDRKDFKRHDLLAWVKSNRGPLANAAVTIVRAYFAAGCPTKGGLAPWGGFESWSDVVRGAIVFAGLPDPSRTRVIVRGTDRSAEVLRMLHVGIREAGNAVTAATIEQLLREQLVPGQQDQYPSLRAGVMEMCGSEFSSRKIGAGLRSFVGRVSDGQRLMSRKCHGNVSQWYVEPVAIAAGNGGDMDRSPPPVTPLGCPEPFVISSVGDGGGGGDGSGPASSQVIFVGHGDGVA